MKYFFVALIVVVSSCKNTHTEDVNSDNVNVKTIPVSDSIEKVKSDSIQQKSHGNIVIEDRPELGSDTLKRKVDNKAWANLVDIQGINPRIKIDLKYATRDNFMKMVLYDTITKVYLQKDVAERLSKCQEFLTKKNPNLYLLVYDGVRPVSVQYRMWKALDSIPVRERVKFVSNPANGSIHNYGAAVDLTICDQNGVALDMGAGYDDIRQIAYPRMEKHFLATGELTKQQVQNREMLRSVMISQNFRNISTEWWHFNACSRQAAKAKYVALQ